MCKSSSFCTGTCYAANLFHEKVIHAAVVMSRSQDVQSIVLPVSRLQSNAADLQTAMRPHLWRQHLVLLTVPNPLRRYHLQIWTVRRRLDLWNQNVHKVLIVLFYCSISQFDFWILSCNCVWSKVSITLHFKAKDITCVCFSTLRLSSFTPAHLLSTRQFLLALFGLTPEAHLFPHPAESQTRWVN